MKKKIKFRGTVWKFGRVYHRTGQRFGNILLLDLGFLSVSRRFSNCRDLNLRRCLRRLIFDVRRENVAIVRHLVELRNVKLYDTFIFVFFFFIIK